MNHDLNSNDKVLPQRFDEFKYLIDETLEDVIERYSHLISEITCVGIELQKVEINKKVVNSLAFPWNHGRTIIIENNDMHLNSLTDLIFAINDQKKKDVQKTCG